MTVDETAATNACHDLLDLEISDRLPNHYELLGLPLFRADSAAIKEAARRRLSQLERYCGGPHDEPARHLAQQVQAACDGMSDPVARLAYDADLKTALLLKPATREQVLKQRSREPLWANEKSIDEGAAHVQRRPTYDSSATSPSAVDHSNFEILRVVGRGRCSVVHEAYERSLRRYVAIKQLDEGFRSDEQQTSLFWKEAQFLASLRHGNIVSVHGVDQQRGWIIMELMSGNLEARLADGPMSHDVVRSVLRQALEGLDYLHRQGKLHGEIKPANLLVDDGGYVKLSTTPGFAPGGEFRVPLGCQRHVAPELLNPKLFGEVGPGVDLYCLGFTALELLIGPRIDELFKGVCGSGADRDMGWLRWHNSHTEAVASVKQLARDVPDDLALVIDRLVRKPVSERYRSADEALADLNEAPILPVAVGCAGEPSTANQRGPGAVPWGDPPDFHVRAGGSAKKAPSLDVGSTGWLERVRRSKHLQLWIESPTARYVLAAVVVVLILMLATTLHSADRDPRLVRVVTEPVGASVRVEGKSHRAVTPAEMHLPPGEHRIWLEKPGYQSVEKIIDVPEGHDPDPFWFRLMSVGPDWCAVRMASNPPGASITLNGQTVGRRTPADLSLTPGEYRLRIEAEGHQPLDKSITVPRKSEWSISWNLAPIPPKPQPPRSPEVAGSLTPLATPARATKAMCYFPECLLI